MTQRERVLTGLAHEEPDRVPIVIGVSNATGITIGPYRDIKRGCAGSRHQTRGCTTGRSSAPTRSMTRRFGGCTETSAASWTWSRLRRAGRRPDRL
jgi:hypothetical protein